MSETLFLYIHIPYCKQRCSYCDFITYEKNKILPSKDYVAQVKKQLQAQKSFFQDCQVQTLYFGGGTPSLIPEEELVELVEVAKKCFNFCEQPEITVEINPGTLGEKKLDHYLTKGINRFSLGVQTFTPWFLKESKRLHSVEDSLKDLQLLKDKGSEFSLDLMFGFPHQSLESLKEDVEKACSFKANHISTYNLTVGKQHALNQNRPSEDTQIEMFQTIEASLSKAQLNKYEISNFSKKGRESKHNLAYWEGKNVMALGVGAHSYLSASFCSKLRGLERQAPYGIRFWQAPNLNAYLEQQLQNPKLAPFDNLPSKQVEWLKDFEALSDFCHTRLRRKKGLSLKELSACFSNRISQKAKDKLLKLQEDNWLERKADHFCLTPKGEILSNQVFLQLTFSKKDFNFVSGTI